MGKIGMARGRPIISTHQALYRRAIVVVHQIPQGRAGAERQIPTTGKMKHFAQPRVAIRYNMSFFARWVAAPLGKQGGMEECCTARLVSCFFFLPMMRCGVQVGNCSVYLDCNSSRAESRDPCFFSMLARNALSRVSSSRNSSESESWQSEGPVADAEWDCTIIIVEFTLTESRI